MKHRIAKPFLSCDSRGFSIVEILVVGAVISLVAAGVMRLMQSGFKNTSNIRHVLIFDAVRARVLGASSSARALVTSQSLNANLLSCLKAVACKDDTLYPFDLYESFVPGTAPLRVGGTAANPARFNLYGQPCLNLSPQCPFEVVTQFRVTCTNAGGFCTIQPRSIQVVFSLQQGAVRLPNQGVAMKPMVSVEGAKVSTTEMAALAVGVSCPNPNQSLVGIHADGTPDCKSTFDSWGYETINAPLTDVGVSCGWEKKLYNLSYTNNPYGIGSASYAVGLEARHRKGDICCPVGKIAVAGGGQCNGPPSGGFLEISVPKTISCWHIDCCSFVSGGTVSAASGQVHCITPP